MTNLPIRRGQLDTANFLAWLAAQGAEIGVPTNGYEVCRYRAYGPWTGTTWQATRVHIIYAKENGLLTYTGASADHYEAFLEARTSELKPASKAKARRPRIDRHGNSCAMMPRKRKALLKRDGAECWYCACELGDDCTIEHLVNRSDGGSNYVDNLVLAHYDCNQRAGNKSLAEKTALRAAMRAETARELI